MAPMDVRLKAALAGMVLSTSIVTAQQTDRPGTSGKPVRQNASTTAQSASREVRSLINGVAIDSNKKPMANVSIRLRNLKVNAVEQVVTANEAGEFSFFTQPDVPYVVEITDHAGRVVAVGDVILANEGEVAGAVVALPARVPAFADMFGGTASSVRSAATGAGLTVVDPALPKVSPTR